MKTISNQQRKIRKTSLTHLIKRVEAKNAAIKNRARKMSVIGRAMKLAHRNTNFAIIHPCTDGKNAWQLTRFDQYGPYSDSRSQTYLECAVFAIEEGFRKIIEIDNGQAA